MPERRDPYGELGDTLGSLVGQHDQATGVGAGSPRPSLPDGRVRPCYPSEQQRVKLSLDVDLEPSVARALANLAGDPPDYYGPGAIRIGDLAVACLVHGLVAFTDGDLDVTAEWTARSRGKRSIMLGDTLNALWDHTLEWLHIGRWPEPDSASAPDPSPPADRQRTASRPPADI